MWLFTTTGFISAVQDRHDSHALIVRARDKQSLLPLAAATGSAITATPTADYPYRTAVTKDAFAAWTRAQAVGIDYPNFKSEVAHTRGHDFADTLMSVWSTMHDVEDAAARIRQ